MKSLRLPLTISVVFYLLFAAFLFWTIPTLTERVATQFGTAGRPTSWMSRAGYGDFMWIIGTILWITPPLRCLLIPKIPIWLRRLIYLPNREYWLAPERQRKTISHLVYYNLWISCLALFLLGGVHYLIVVANRQIHPHLAQRELLVLVIIFLTGVAAASYKMLMPLTKKDGGLDQ